MKNLTNYLQSLIAFSLMGVSIYPATHNDVVTAIYFVIFAYCWTMLISKRG